MTRRRRALIALALIALCGAAFDWSCDGIDCCTVTVDGYTMPVCTSDGAAVYAEYCEP